MAPADEDEVRLMDVLRRHQPLFAYDDWANRETLASIAAAAAPRPRSLKLLAHIAGAERLWLGRRRREEKPAVVWPDFDLARCRAAVEDLSRLWTGYLQGLTPPGLDDTVSYVNSKGEPWTSGVEDILTHTVLHSSYHRGQIAADMRASGHAPASTDYIHARRQGFVS
jgi:uncharacterized damage-inducible protein DinB